MCKSCEYFENGICHNEKSKEYGNKREKDDGCLQYIWIGW